MRTEEEELVGPSQVQSIDTNHSGKYINWCGSINWKDDRNRYEATNLCRAMDSFLTEHIIPSDSPGFEILARRLACLHRMNESKKAKNPSSVAAQSEYCKEEEGNDSNGSATSSSLVKASSSTEAMLSSSSASSNKRYKGENKNNGITINHLPQIIMSMIISYEPFAMNYWRRPYYTEGRISINRQWRRAFQYAPLTLVIHQRVPAASKRLRQDIMDMIEWLKCIVTIDVKDTPEELIANMLPRLIKYHQSTIRGLIWRTPTPTSTSLAKASTPQFELNQQLRILLSYLHGLPRLAQIVTPDYIPPKKNDDDDDDETEEEVKKTLQRKKLRSLIEPMQLYARDGSSLNGCPIRKCDSCRVVTLQPRCDAGDECVSRLCSDCEPTREPCGSNRCGKRYHWTFPSADAQIIVRCGSSWSCQHHECQPVFDDDDNHDSKISNAEIAPSSLSLTNSGSSSREIALAMARAASGPSCGDDDCGRCTFDDCPQNHPRLCSSHQQICRECRQFGCDTCIPSCCQ
jgi:hypothetical protein